MNIPINISQQNYDKLLSFAIRTNDHLINLSLNIVDYLLNYYCYDNLDNNSVHRVIIVKHDSYRIIFQEPDKIFSICFPFKIENIDNNFIITDFYNNEIRNAELSLLKSIFKKDEEENKADVSELKDPLDFYSDLEEIFIDYPDILWKVNDVWQIVIKLLTYEYGYIRFDDDPINANGKIHPLFHFDMAYCNYATYKFGLNKRISLDQFIDMFNPETDQLHFNL